METKKTLRFDISEINAGLIKEAEGEGFSGWKRNLFATIEEDNLTIGIGAPVSHFTWYVDADGYPRLDHVGFIYCWNRQWAEEDAELWAEATGFEEDDFDCEVELDCEANLTVDFYRDGIRAVYRRIEGKDLQTFNIESIYTEDDAEDMMYNIAVYAKSKGYNFIELI